MHRREQMARVREEVEEEVHRDHVARVRLEREIGRADIRAVPFRMLQAEAARRIEHLRVAVVSRERGVRAERGDIAQPEARPAAEIDDMRLLRRAAQSPPPR